MLVGDGTIIEEGALVGAAAVGSYVHVGKRAIVVSGSPCISLVSARFVP
jgi:carbonic anhydrase/acetyltransferase-like protein (isoleucine patch superfamily)